MSYSFSVTAVSKPAALLAVAAKFAEMAVSQPMHARDFKAAIANADAVINLLEDDDTKHIAVSCNGYVSWSGVHGDHARNPLRGASVAASASFIDPPAKEND